MPSRRAGGAAPRYESTSGHENTATVIRTVKEAGQPDVCILASVQTWGSEQQHTAATAEDRSGRACEDNDKS